MSDPVIVSAARTAIGTASKGTLANTTGEELATVILRGTLDRSHLDPSRVDDVVFAESMYGGVDLARHAAVVNGLTDVPGQAVNRHCAGSLTPVGNAAASIRSSARSAGTPLRPRPSPGRRWTPGRSAHTRGRSGRSTPRSSPTRSCP